MFVAEGIMHTVSGDTGLLKHIEYEKLLPLVMTPYSLLADSNRGHIKMMVFSPCRWVRNAIQLEMPSIWGQPTKNDETNALRRQ